MTNVARLRTLDEYLASGPYEFCDMMQPGYAAIWREAHKAEEAMLAARKALEAATRPRLTVVAT